MSEESHLPIPRGVMKFQIAAAADAKVLPATGLVSGDPTAWTEELSLSLESAQPRTLKVV